MKRLRHGWQHASLATRIVLVMVSLLLLVQAAGFWAVQRAVERQVAGEIQATLQVGERVWRRLLLQSADRLREAAVVLALQQIAQDQQPRGVNIAPRAPRTRPSASSRTSSGCAQVIRRT